MAGCDDDDQLIPSNSVRCERRLIEPALDEAEFRRAREHGGGGLRSVADGQPDVDAGIGAAEGHQMARQAIAVDGLAGL